MNSSATKLVWSGFNSIMQGAAAVAIVSTVVTLLMIVSIWFQSLWAWRFSVFLGLCVVGLTHLLAVCLHRGRPFQLLDFVGMLLVPLAAPFASVFALRAALVSLGGTTSRPDEYFLMFLWSFGACFIGIPSVWRLFWLYTADPNEGKGGVFSKPHEPKFRSTTLPRK